MSKVGANLHAVMYDYPISGDSFWMSKSSEEALLEFS
jgi:hypothetical protein